MERAILRTSENIPNAVTAAPAPAPWTIKGLGNLLVVNAMMLSDPFKEANG